MLQLLAFVVALAGSTLGALWDLRTTEIPDEVPYAMAAIAMLLYGYQSFMEWSVWPLAWSVAVGAAFFGFGFLMYRLGQWGGGDAKLLAAVGCLLPSVSSLPAELASVGIEAFQDVRMLFPFPASYFFNVFFVGAAYMMLYAFVVAARNRGVFAAFGNDVKASSRVFLAIAAALFIAFTGINLMLYRNFGMHIDPSSMLSNSLMPVAAAACIFLVWKFAHAVENVGFKRTVPVSRLCVGDVLDSSKIWEGVTAADIRRIKRSGVRRVRVKEGVRFAPAFPLALLFTLWAGDAIMIVFSFIV
ncbi:MAG: A24 family peptidase [Candidatus Aenigmatarchaeota archaeon]